MPRSTPALAPVSAELREAILTWYAARGRTLPFRDTTDPYGILVSEAMAQQTQAARAGEAWTRFMATFPTVQALADAPPADVLRAWQGLGYNRRAINLQRAARIIVDEHGGRVPSDLGALEALPGVGPYTARAVAALAFGIPVGAVDTNVRRVLGRIVAGETGVLDAATLQRIADDAVPPDRPGFWTHALMDIGATLCRPRRPLCDACPAQPWCRFAASPQAEPSARAVRETAAPFTSTSRWLRGRIVERLRAAPNGEWVVIATPIGDHDQDAVGRALDALARDGRRPAGPVRPSRRPSPRPAPDMTPRVGYASGAMPATVRPTSPDAAVPLPADDPAIFTMDLRALRGRWAAQAAMPAISAAAMVGADARAQAFGFPQDRLMEHAGTAVAAAVRALAMDLDRWGTGPIVILCGPGNNGGDGYVAARRLALAGAHVIVAVAATDMQPSGGASARNWDRIARDAGIAKVHIAVPRDVAIFGKDIAKSAVVVDALLGTGVRGALRQPIRAAVELIADARTAGVPIVAVDTPTAVDLSSGEPSDPVVHADLTVTFHRAKTGLLTRQGAAYAGRVLVAPIGIPVEADRG